MSYRPGVPLYDLDLRPGSSFRTVNAVPVPSWRGAMGEAGVPIYDLDLRRGSSFRTVDAFRVPSWKARAGMGLGQDGGAPTAEQIAQGRRDAALANEAGIPVPVLRAIRAIESGASASATRFEPHLFHRDTHGRYRSQIPYTPGATRAASSVSSETNRAAFERAKVLDPRVAVTSTSWGSYQVLGQHLLRLFGGDPARSVQTFDADPETTSERIFVSWMSASPLARTYARSLDFAAFAHRYNGCASPCALYAGRLQAAYTAALPLWRRVEPLIGVRTLVPWPTWAPWAIASGIGASVLGGIGAVTWAMTRGKRRRSKG